MTRMPNFEAEIKREFGHLFHHGQSQAPAQTPVTITATAPEGEPVSAVADLQNFAHELAAKAAELEQTVLPAAAGTLSALEGNPVVNSLLNAVHVPPEDFDIVVAMIDKLETIWRPADTAAAEPVAAVPAQ